VACRWARGRGVRVVLGSLLLAACARMPLAAAQSVPLGQTFPLKVGQSITVEADGLEVVFERVVSDSRCPRGVQCIRAGEATISVAAEKAPAARAAIELRTVASAAEAAYGPTESACSASTRTPTRTAVSSPTSIKPSSS